MTTCRPASVLILIYAVPVQFCFVQEDEEKTLELELQDLNPELSSPTELMEELGDPLQV